MPDDSPAALDELRATVRELSFRLAVLEKRFPPLPTLPPTRADGLVKDLHDLEPPKPQVQPLPPIAAPQNLSASSGAETYDVVQSPEALPAAGTPEALTTHGTETSAPFDAPPSNHVPPAPPPPPPGIRAAAFAARNMTAPVPDGARGHRPDSLESKIGKSWTSIVGGLVLLGAILFFLKYAWDQGWLDMSPGLRIAMTMAAGALLVGLGEWAFAKKMGALAASLSATGLAVLMAAFFAGGAAFEIPVFPREVAFGGIIAVGALGIVLALHMRMLALAFLALLGMYVSPAILGSHKDQSLQFLVYIAVVTAAGLALSFFKRRWLAVRILAFVAGWLWLLGWTMAGPVAAHRELAVAACALFFLMFLGEMTASLLRVMSPGANPDAAERPASPNTVLLETGTALLSIANSAAAMIAFALVFNRADIFGLWIVPLGMAGALAVLALAAPSRYFAISASVQSVALIALAVPLYFSGTPITLAWGIMGLALAAYAYFTGSRAAHAWSLIILVLVLIRVCLFDIFSPSLQAPLFAAGSVTVDRWMLLGWGAGLYALLVAWLGRLRDIPREDGSTFPRGALWLTGAGVGIGTFLWCVTSVVSLHADGQLTVACLVWVLGLNLFGRCTVAAPRALVVETAAVALLLACSAKWFIYDGMALSVLPPEAAGTLRATWPFLNLFVLNALIMAASIASSRSLRAQGWAPLAWWIAAIAFVTLNVEALRSTDFFLHDLSLRLGGSTDPWLLKNVVISSLWGALGLGGVIVGFARKIAPVRWAALALLGAAVLKVLLIDMANVNTILRVLSFMVVGVVLLLVSLVYHKAAKAPRPAT